MLNIDFAIMYVHAFNIKFINKYVRQLSFISIAILIERTHFLFNSISF
jgi:hypothetical protein